MPQKILPNAVRSEAMKQGGIVAKQETFQGRPEELAGYVFDVTTARNANNVSRTLKEVARHVGSTSKYGTDLRRTIEKEKLFGIARPIKPSAPASEASPTEQEAYEMDTDIYREDVKNFVRRRSILLDNMGRTYEIIWGQCSDVMRAKVESSIGFDTVHENSDVLGLIKMIKLASFDFHSQKNSAHALIEVEKAFLNFLQRDASTELYHEQFKSLYEAFVSCGGSLGYNIGLIEKHLMELGVTLAGSSPSQMSDTVEYVQGEYIGCMFLLNSDRRRFGTLL